jgi:hypothetical protein
MRRTRWDRPADELTLEARWPEGDETLHVVVQRDAAKEEADPGARHRSHRFFARSSPSLGLMVSIAAALISMAALTRHRLRRNTGSGDDGRSPEGLSPG